MTHGTLYSHTEAELIQAARSGDGGAFADLLRPHYQPAFRVAYGLLHDASAAEDAVQEGAFKAWRRLANVREGASIRPWFLAIVANQCRGTSQSRWSVWTAQCDDTNPTASGCQTDAAKSIPILQKWLDDLKSSATPTRFFYIDAELRAQLTQNLAALRQLETDAGAGNRAAMAADYVVAVYAVDWTGTVVPLILQSQQVSAAGYRNVVALQQRQLDLCLASCTLLASNDAKSCVTNGGIPCLGMFDEVAVNFATESAMLVRDAAPESLAAEDSRLQADLESAGAVLLQMRLAVGHGDQAGINSGIAQLLRVSTRIDQDAKKIANA